MKLKKIYVVIGVVVLGVVAIFFFEGSALKSVAQNCSFDTSRPCFEQEISNNSSAAVSSVVKKEKLDKESGEKEFSACVKKGSNRQGEEKERTKICDTEVIKYCEGTWSGDKNNNKNGNVRIKKYEGKCESESSPSPTVSFISPASGRGWVPNTGMLIKINVANYSDPIKYGGLMFNLIHAGSIIQTFSYDLVSFDIDMPSNGQPTGPWIVPSSIPAGSNYKLEAYFANFPNKKIVSAPFSILGDSVKINGQVVDAFTGAPLQAKVQYIQNGITVEPLTYVSGNFSITQPTTASWESGFNAVATCYMYNPSLQGWFDTDGARFSYLYNFMGDNSFGIIMNNEMFIQPESIFIPVTGPSVNNIKMREWPAVDIAVTSDIPVTVRFTYGSKEGGSGPSFYSVSWPKLTSVIPLDQDTTVTLTAENGTAYVSPVIHLSRKYGCAPVTLNFSGGKFTWQY